jgi:hypothetical protein
MARARKTSPFNPLLWMLPSPPTWWTRIVFSRAKSKYEWAVVISSRFLLHNLIA